MVERVGLDVVARQCRDDPLFLDLRLEADRERWQSHDRGGLPAIAFELIFRPGELLGPCLEYKDLEPGKSSTTAGFQGLEAARREIAEAGARAG
jgi:hypothetical protein